MLIEQKEDVISTEDDEIEKNENSIIVNSNIIFFILILAIFKLYAIFTMLFYNIFMMF